MRYFPHFYVLSLTVLTWWVAPPKMFCNWYRIYWSRNQLWNCTHFRYSTDEQLRHVDIYFSATNIICSLSTLNWYMPRLTKSIFSRHSHTPSRERFMRIHNMITTGKALWCFVKFSLLILSGNIWRINMWTQGVKEVRQGDISVST